MRRPVPFTPEVLPAVPGEHEVSPPQDRELARLAGLGDRAAFGELVDRHGAAMFRYATGMLDGDGGAAEDAVQEAWTAAWRSIGGFRGEAEVRTWLFRITANQVLGARRRRRPVAVDDHLLSVLPAPAQHDPARQAELQQMWRHLELALGELPWRQRAVWLLREMERLSYGEIATVLDLSPTVVRGQLHRARSSVEIRMAQWR